ncbi:Uncharacterised protein [uncultured Clostridium sp.]|nr:Uncharacterised protein [uncultured Clostridium sp.]SCJ18326.1 Uncharacterised protein [uncultured Clostridium sp.]
MYRVQLKYLDVNSKENPIIFDCQYFDSEKYNFKNVVMGNFIINKLEVNNEHIALIKIK